MTTPTLLIIDDESDIRLALSEILSEEGYAVETAADGGDALAQLHAGLRPSLILLDLMMPGVDGRAFREAQLRDPELADIPVLLFSAYADVKAIADELGTAGGLRKPVDIDVLLEAVEAARR